MRLAALAPIAGVWVLGIMPPRRAGFTDAYVLTFTALLVLMIVVDQQAPYPQAPRWRRALWLGLELLIAYLIVRVQGTLVRPMLIYLVPAVRAPLMFNGVAGLAASLLVWPVYALNVTHEVWPDRLHEYPNYLSFLLPPYAVAVALTLVTLRQAADRRRIMALYDELQSAHAELRALHERVREAAVAEERNRLAREIHDSLAHYLTVVNVQLEAAEKLAPQQLDKALDQVRRARRLTLDCLQEVRRSVAALRDASLDELTLPHALRRLTSEFAESTGIAVGLESELGDDLRLPPETSLALYRAAQEGLTNVYRHARARSVRVSLTRTKGRVELNVIDDGSGPPPHGTGEASGFGLLGLRERVELLGGQLSFDRVSSGGSRLSVALPIGETA